MERIQITIDMPAHLREWFLGITSCSVEQSYMECYHDNDFSKGKYICVNYPGWHDKIVITEHESEE